MISLRFTSLNTGLSRGSGKVVYTFGLPIKKKKTTTTTKKNKTILIIIYFNNLLLVYKIFQINDLIASLYAFLRGIFWASPISSKLCNIGINDTFRICSDWSVLGSVLYTHTHTALSVDSILLPGSTECACWRRKHGCLQNSLRCLFFGI